MNAQQVKMFNIRVSPRENVGFVAVDQNEPLAPGQLWLAREKKGFGATPWEAILDLANNKVATEKAKRERADYE